MAGSQAPLAKVSVGSAVKAALLMEFHYSQASERKSVTSMADVFPDALRASSNKGDQIWEPYPCCRNIICACLLHQGKMLLGCALQKYLLTLAVKIPGKQPVTLSKLSKQRGHTSTHAEDSASQFPSPKGGTSSQPCEAQTSCRSNLWWIMVDLCYHSLSGLSPPRHKEVCRHILRGVLNQ